MNIITDNPFRTLGVYSNASAKEIAANKAKLAAYLKVGRNVEFPTDNLLSIPIQRTTERVDQAVSDINLPADKLKYALFWFIKSSPIDEIALNHLAAGNDEKATELFGKKETFSSLQDTSTLALYNEDYDTAIAAATKLIHEDELRTAFVKAVCGETFLIEEDKMAHLFIDTLCEELPDEDWRQLFKDSGQSFDDDEYLNAKAVGAPLRQIEDAIATAKNVDDDDAKASYKAGTTLMSTTKKPLVELKDILEAEDMQYQMIADKLANQILQSSINYFNNTDDNDNVDKALDFAKYALSIAVGQMAKDRCKQNVDILKQRKEENGIRNDMNAIAIALETFQTKTDTISNAEILLNECRPHLVVLKNKLGIYNDLYLKISSAVANNTISMIVTVINKLQQQIYIDKEELRSKIEDAISVFTKIENMNMDKKTTLRFEQNNALLQKIMVEIMYAIKSEEYTRNNKSQSNSSSGCYIATMVYGDYDHPQVMRLRKFRDEVLEKIVSGGHS